MKTKTTTKEEGKTLIKGASALADVIFGFFATHDEFNAYTFGITAYATEILMSYYAQQIGKNYDSMSRDYREYLEVVHGDVKRLSGGFDPNVN